MPGFTQWVDYDNDNDLDIVVGGKLYRNNKIVSSKTNTICSSQIRIYPNPLNSIIVIEGIQKNDEVSIINSLGQPLKKSNHIAASILYFQISFGNYG